jgi:hypothetical protein
MTTVAGMMRRVLCIAVSLGMARFFCHGADLLARPIANASDIDWIETTAELLSFLAFLEGLPLAIKLMFSQAAPLPKPGRLFMAVCTLYMTGYVAINSVRIVMDWLVHSPNPPMIDGMEPSLVGPFENGLAAAFAQDFIWSWSNDWAQLGYLCLPVLVMSWSLSPRSTGVKPARADSTEWLGRSLLIVFPLAAVFHEAFRPGLR